MSLIRLLWMLTLGWMGALVCYTIGVLACVTIIGIPFGVIMFQFGKKWFNLRF